MVLFLAVPTFGFSDALQARLDGAVPGQVVEVPPGVWSGTWTIDRPVILRGRPGSRLVHPEGTPGPTLWIRSPGTRVEDLDLEGSGEGTRRDHTAVVVTASDVVLQNLRIRRAWSGIWVDGAHRVTLTGIDVAGLEDYPFWQRGEGVRVSNARGIELTRLTLRSVLDGVYFEGTRDIVARDIRVSEGRYGLHLMFSSQAEVLQAVTSRVVAGILVMESSGVTVADSQFTDGYRTGSAGVRQVRTKNVRIVGNQITRQAAAVEILDARDGRFEANRLAQNGTAWTWGGDNSGTLVTENRHQGNLADFAGRAPLERDLVGTDAHQHGVPTPAATVAPSRQTVRPQFDRNLWDAWRGTDLDHDGLGDTPYRFDLPSAARAATQPWAGIFLGSPWSQWAQTLPAGEAIDAHPLVN